MARAAERHRTSRIGWLRAAVLGANDGILSTASLLLGVAAAHGSPGGVLIAGVSGLVAGAMSMAAGEYVSVQSQADTEAADLALELGEQQADIVGERAELAQIYVGRGLAPGLAAEVALQLMAKDALGAHARDELGLSEALRARPVQAALTSAASFAAGAILPVIAAAFAPEADLIVIVGGVSLLLLGVLGGLAAWAGGAKLGRAAARVVFWGALAMGVTAGIGAFAGQLI